jgi:DNA invertase Pin-like site-specific DNA recombinase
MAKLYGYCRISNPSQNIERQVRNILAAYPKAKLYEEAWTGTTSERPKFQKLLSVIKAGDTIVFDSVSRMSRNAQEGIEIYLELFDKGVELVFLKEPHINTETYRQALTRQIDMTGETVDFILEGVNKYLKELAKEQIRIAFDQAEKEVQDLRQRTKEGMITAKNNGKRIGTPKGAVLRVKKYEKSRDIIRKHSKAFGGSLDDAEVQKLCGVSRKTYYKYKNRVRNETIS